MKNFDWAGGNQFLATMFGIQWMNSYLNPPGADRWSTFVFTLVVVGVGYVAAGFISADRKRAKALFPGHDDPMLPR